MHVLPILLQSETGSRAYGPGRIAAIAAMGALVAGVVLRVRRR
jgi:hypothetical protein